MKQKVAIFSKSVLECYHASRARVFNNRGGKNTIWQKIFNISLTSKLYRGLETIVKLLEDSKYGYVNVYAQFNRSFYCVKVKNVKRVIFLHIELFVRPLIGLAQKL